MESFVSLPLHELDPEAVQQALRKIGEAPV
jgi:hypothetical protein